MDSTDLLATGALLTGIAGIVTAWAGLTRARGEARAQGDAICEQRLADARAEAEAATAALHRYRMGQ